jgi:hypothetical protein
VGIGPTGGNKPPARTTGNTGSGQVRQTNTATGTAQAQGTGTAQTKGQGQVADGFQQGTGRAGPALQVAAAAGRKPPDTVYDGAYVGAGGKTYPPTTPLSEVDGVKPSNGARPNGTIVYVNGINTTKETQSNSLQKIADKTGANVIGIHNATEGTVKDLAQCVGDKLDIGKNPAVDTVADTVYKELKAGRGVHLMAHSQGGLITSRALNDVKNRLRMEDGMSKQQAKALMANVSVETFGAAAVRYPDGPQYVHYVNRADPVPSLVGQGAVKNPFSDPGKNGVVHRFTEAHLNPIASHSFDDLYLNRRVPFAQARAGQFN